MCVGFLNCTSVFETKNVNKFLFTKKRKSLVISFSYEKSGSFFIIYMYFMACMTVNPIVGCNLNNLKYYIPLLSYLFCY